VQFPQRPRERPSNHQATQESKKNTLNGELAAARHEVGAHPVPVEPQVVPESRYLLLSLLHDAQILRKARCLFLSIRHRRGGLIVYHKE
jgi:hypothetical protein